VTTTFDADAFRSADFAAFLRTLLGPIEIPDTTDVESYDLCRGCLGRSVEFSRGPAGYIDNCNACVDDALRARGLVMTYCHACAGMQGVMPVLPGQTPDEFNHVHFLPLAVETDPKAGSREH
jgi:hypothetical protein